MQPPPVPRSLSSGAVGCDGGGGWGRGDTRAAFAIAAVALVLRVLCAALAQTPGTDAYAYVLFAREVPGGTWSSLDHGIHPGYPVMIALFAVLLRDVGVAAHVVSIAFSTLSMLPFFAMVRDMAGRRVAILSTLGYACVPYFIVEHADVMTEGLFHFLFLSSVALAWFGVTRCRFDLMMLAGMAGALAYHTRPEGIYCAAALCGLTVMAWVRARPAAWRNAAYAAAAVAVCFMLIYPLLLWWRHRAGGWVVSYRESVDVAMGALGLPGSKAGWSGQPAAWSGVLWKLAKTLLQLTFFALPLAAAAFAPGRMRPLGAAFLVALAVGCALPVLVAAKAGYPLSHRQLLLPVLFALPFCAVGFCAAVDALAARWPAAPVGRVAAVAAGVALTAVSLQAVHPRRLDRVPVREAGCWVRSQAAPRVFTNTLLVGYYLDRRPEGLPQSLDELRAFEFRSGDVVVVVESDCVKQMPEGLECLRGRLRLERRFAGERAVSVFVR